MMEEKCLLLAVRNRLRSVCEYSDQECDVEFDEQVPAIAGERYIIVTTEGITRGPHQDKSGTVRDLLFAVGVTVIKRTRNVPRDRTRDVFVNNLGSLDAEIEAITTAIDWKYDVINAASQLLVTEGLLTQEQLDDHPGLGFHHPLVFSGVDAKPRMVSPEVFAGHTVSNQAAGMARTVHFGAARRTRYVNV